MASDSDRLTKLQALLAVEPEDGFLLYGVAQELQKLGRTDEAVAHYDRAIGVDPKECYAFFHKARSLVRFAFCKKDSTIDGALERLARYRSRFERGEFAAVGTPNAASV